MKKIQKIALLGILSTILVSLVISCNNDSDDNNLNAVADNSYAESTYSDIHSIVDQAFLTSTSKDGESVTSPFLNACATITHDTFAIPHTININFGPTNCLCGDNRYRRGEILVSYTGHYRDSGTVISITFNNYFVNDNQILGSKTITNNGRNANNNLHYTINVNGNIIKANNGGTIVWNSVRDREWLFGSETNAWMDDVYLINGTANGTSATGNIFSVNITTPLRKEIGCKHFVSGIFDLQITGRPTRTFDYGSGECDSLATVTINGNLFTITLH